MFQKRDRSAPNYSLPLATGRNAFSLMQFISRQINQCILYFITRLVLSRPTKGLRRLATVTVELEKHRQPYFK